MGNLQRNFGLAELGDTWIRPFVQLLLDCDNHCLPCDAIQREERSLAIDEIQGWPVRQQGQRQ